MSRWWLVSLSAVSLTGSALLLMGLRGWPTPHASTLRPDLPTSLLGLAVLVGTLHWWAKLLSGRTWFSTRQIVALDGGGMSVPEPTRPYELWIQSPVALVRYHGAISILQSSGRVSIITLPEIKPLLGRAHSRPIISETLLGAASSGGQCRLSFSLSPTGMGDSGAGRPREEARGSDNHAVHVAVRTKGWHK